MNKVYQKKSAILILHFWVMGAEIVKYVVLVCESYNEPIHGIVEHQSTSIHFLSSDVILVSYEPILSAKRHVYFNKMKTEKYHSLV